MEHARRSEHTSLGGGADEQKQGNKLHVTCWSRTCERKVLSATGLCIEVRLFWQKGEVEVEVGRG